MWVAIFIPTKKIYDICVGENRNKTKAHFIVSRHIVCESTFESFSARCFCIIQCKILFYIFVCTFSVSPCLSVSRETLCTACLGFSLANQQIYSSHGNMTPSKQSATEHQQWHWQQRLRIAGIIFQNFRESFVLMLFKYV